MLSLQPRRASTASRQSKQRTLVSLAASFPYTVPHQTKTLKHYAHRAPTNRILSKAQVATGGAGGGVGSRG